MYLASSTELAVAKGDGDTRGWSVLRPDDNVPFRPD